MLCPDNTTRTSMLGAKGQSSAISGVPPTMPSPRHPDATKCHTASLLLHQNALLDLLVLGAEEASIVSHDHLDLGSRDHKVDFLQCAEVGVVDAPKLEVGADVQVKEGQVAEAIIGVGEPKQLARGRAVGDDLVGIGDPAALAAL